MAYLGAFISLDDNIRDQDEAETCAGLGLLYLKAIELWLEVVSISLHSKMLDKNTALFKELAMLYNWLHLSAKRFLAYVIDIYRAETAHERCNHVKLGLAYRALGDLLFISDEILLYVGNLITDAIKRTQIPSLKSLRKIIDNSEWKKILKGMIAAPPASHVDDRDVTGCRIQASENYRKALRESLAEIEDYLKRYRFPNDAYLSHGNVMDRQMHYDICATIQPRHWDYFNPSSYNVSTTSSEEIEQNAADLLNEVTRELYVFSFEPPSGEESTYNDCCPAPTIRSSFHESPSAGGLGHPPKMSVPVGAIGICTASGAGGLYFNALCGRTVL